MGINYEKLLKRDKNHKIDKDLLTDIEYNEILFIISKELVNYRDENKLKQEDLAKKLNMSQVMISKMESGKYNYTIKSLVNLWNNLSTEKVNFGARLLWNIYNKIVKNYNYIRVELNQGNVDEEFDYDEKAAKTEKISVSDVVSEAYTIEDYTYDIAC
ncbi:MAG: helix-turn-helix transcriptional regulator [Clostridia bacterium]|nr:helix-turn-helix transcriptional regulator [Clostridia bacterium]